MLIHKHYNNTPEHTIALNLYKYGVEKVRIHHQSICGYDKPEYAEIWGTSFTCYPGIKVNGEPLLWELLRHYKIRYSGGAGDTYMQASFTKESIKEASYDVKGRDPQLLIYKIVLLFQAMKDLNESQEKI